MQRERRHAGGEHGHVVPVTIAGTEWPEVAERKSFLLRIDERLYEDLKRWAGAELRSVNAQIEFLLRRAADEHLRRTGGNDRTPP